MAPIQKPGRSKQDYCTPPLFLAALKQRLGIGQFDIDLAASAENAICMNYYDEQMNALKQSWKVTQGGWAFCNPPFAHIHPWVEKAGLEAAKGAQVAMLVPVSTGANWWYGFVHDDCHVLFLNGRLTFVGETAPYPKDCAILLYTPYIRTGYDIWDWRLSAPKA